MTEKENKQKKKIKPMKLLGKNGEETRVEEAEDGFDANASDVYKKSSNSKREMCFQGTKSKADVENN